MAVTWDPSLPCRPKGIWPTADTGLAAIVAPPASEAVQVQLGAFTPDGTPAGTLRPIAAPICAGVASAQSSAAVKPMPDPPLLPEELEEPHAETATSRTAAVSTDFMAQILNNRTGGITMRPHARWAGYGAW